MTSGTHVSDILDGNLVSVRPATPIRRAVAMLVDGGAEAAAVTSEDGTLLGILTQKDCFRPAIHASYYQEWRGTVADHMTEGAVTIDAGADIIMAAEMFLEHPHRVLPVVRGPHPVGMLNRARVLESLTRTG